MNERLVLFDVDGTLCDTAAVDEECFLRACAEALGTTVLDADWSRAAEVTDIGVLRYLWFGERGVLPTAEEEAGVAERFLNLLETALARTPERFMATPGVHALISLVSERWQARAATGGWLAAARLKLQAARIPTELLVASCDDSFRRADVFRLAAGPAESQGFGRRVVLVGDGPWDVRVARDLGWGFVGIASGQQAERLRELGAQAVYQDFLDATAFETALRREAGEVC